MSTFKSKQITFAVLTIFSLFSATPQNCAEVDVSNMGQEAIFGYCKLKRIKKKTKKLKKYIKAYRENTCSLEEIELLVASIKKDAKKAFKKNYKVRKIMERANDLIESHMLSLIDQKQQQSDSSCTPSIAVGDKSQGSVSEYWGNLPRHVPAIGDFVANLRAYEESDVSAEVLDEQLSFLTQMNREDHQGRLPKQEQDEVKTGVLYSYVCIFCGCLLLMLPFPSAKKTGGTLVSSGFINLGLEKWEEVDEENKKNRERG